MTELKIGDEGKTDSGFWPTYKIVAAHSDGRLICELIGTGVPNMGTVKGDKVFGIKLLPPTPKLLTVRRWLRMSGSSIWNADATVAAVREADITYGPDGRIVSITFADEM